MSTQKLPKITSIKKRSTVTSAKKPPKVTKGDKIQIYNLDGTLFETHNSVTAAVRNSQIKLSANGINTAIADKNPYKEHRFMHLTRDKPDSTIQPLPQTVIIKNKVNNGFVAAFSENDPLMEHIINVYADKKTAAETLDVAKSTITNNIKRNGLCANKYYLKNWDDCSEKQKAEYLTNANLPEKSDNSHAVKIDQIDKITGKLITVYKSESAVIKENIFSISSLKEAIANNTELGDFKWKLHVVDN
jgi:hypothetical protein